MGTVAKDAEGGQVITVTGGVGLDEAGAIKALLLDAFGEHDAVTVDLSGVTEVDTCFLQVLVSAQKSAEKRGVRLTLSDTSEELRRAAGRLGFNLSYYGV